jgi:uncharacterized SAM-binding protein YcdF (DUF218 family)
MCKRKKERRRRRIIIIIIIIIIRNGAKTISLPEFHETWWSYRYMFLVGPKVLSFVVKGVKVIF